MLEAQRAAFFADLPVSPAMRCDRLRRCALMIAENADALCDALAIDHPNQDRAAARFGECVPSLAVLCAAEASVAHRIRPAGRAGVLGWLSRDPVDYLPVGIVGIAVPASRPLLAMASLLAGAFAAGNRAIVAVEGPASQFGGLIADMVPRYFDPLELSVASRTAFAALPFDLRVSGAAQIGEDRAGDERMTIMHPGPSPVVFGRSADYARAAEDIIARKRPDDGRAPLAPDYLLVPDDREEEAANWLWRAAMKADGGQAAATAEEQLRLQQLLDDARARGAEVLTADGRGAAGAFHILRHASDDMLVMQSGFQGPILPIRNYTTVADAIAISHRRPVPLAIYYHGSDADEHRHLLDRMFLPRSATEDHIRARARIDAAMTLNIGPGEAAFRRFSRPRPAARHPVHRLARWFARGTADDRTDTASAMR